MVHAREQVKQMVTDGVSLRRIKSYLRRWCAWWVKSSQSWQAQELLVWFLEVCWDTTAASIATDVIRETTWTYQGYSPASLNTLLSA